MGFPTGYKSEVPPPRVWFHLLEQLRALREAFYLPDYLFVIRGHNSRTAWQERCTGQGMGEEHRPSVPSSGLPLPPHFEVLTNLEVFWTQVFWVFMWALLPKHNWCNLWPLGTELNFQHLSLPPGPGNGTRSSISLVTRLVPGQLSPFLSVVQKSPH